MWSAILGFFSWLLGKIFAPDTAAADRKAGENLGQAETERDNAESGLSEVQRAADAQPVPAPPSGLRGASDPAAASFTPGQPD